MGLAEVGVVLESGHTYTDANTDPEGVSTYKWSVADAADGTKAEIADATSSTYLLTTDEIGKFIFVEVTPVAAEGDAGYLIGDAVVSAATITAVVADDETDVVLDRLWVRGSAWDSRPSWFGSLTERGFAVGTENMYVVNRRYGDVRILDAMNGSEKGKLDTTGVNGGTFSMLDVNVSDDGSILVANLAIGDNAEFKVYRWETETSAPTVLISYSYGVGTSRRLGDNFSVYGDVSGDAIIMVADASSNEVIRWVITDGVVADAEVLTLDEITAFGMNPSATAKGTATADGFIVNGWSIAPTVFDANADKVGEVALVESTTNLSVKYLEFAQRDWMLMAQEGVDRQAWLVDITSGITTDESVMFAQTETIGEESNGSHNADVDYLIDGENLYIYLLVPSNGIAAYKVSVGTPPVVSNAFTNAAGTEIEVVFDRAVADVTGKEAEFAVTVDDNAVTVASVAPKSADDTRIVLTLGSAIASGTDIKLAYTAGTVSSLEGVPLNSFTDQAVLNLAGAEAPVASNVAYTGTIDIGETLTATYDYSDANDDLEATSLFQWWIADDAQGTNKAIVPGENAETYVVVASDLGSYIAVQVTPVTATGGESFLTGDAVLSAWTEIVSGISDLAAFDIKMYPNPVSSTLYLTNTSDINEVVISNVAGQEILKIKTQNSDNLEINTSEFTKGLYFISLYKDNGVAVGKFIKL